MKYEKWSIFQNVIRDAFDLKSLRGLCLLSEAKMNASQQMGFHQAINKIFTLG